MDELELSRVTVKDVAKFAGVSTATVTRTLRQRELVVPETRQRVLAAIEALKYRPNPMAQDLRNGGRTAAVGLTIASFTNAFQTGVAAGAERELRRAGLQLLIGSSDLDLDHEPELAKAMVDRRVSAILAMPDGEDRSYLAAERLYGTPVILVGRPANGLAADVVTTDDDRGVEEATEALLARGHRRIAALAGVAGSFRASQRLEGFRRALSHHGIPESPRLTITGLETAEAARAAARALLDAETPPTAIVALNLGISDGVLIDRITQQRQNAYIALDETELSVGLGISAVVRDPEELGRQAAKMAISRIHNPDQSPRTLVLPSRVVARGSGEIAPM